MIELGLVNLGDAHAIAIRIEDSRKKMLIMQHPEGGKRYSVSEGATNTTIHDWGQERGYEESFRSPVSTIDQVLAVVRAVFGR